MFDPSSFLGALFIGLLGAALFWLLQWGIRNVSRVNVGTPAGIILCVAIAVITVLLLAAIIVAALPHGTLARLLI
ncbi:hypothetical protein ACH47C_11095 [Streptomyces rishiriensis]|uniref:hypothetical protein n=1 Tax=Streptomyces rishiriensis TaxID=68264 RepID=UPI0033DB8B23